MLLMITDGQPADDEVWELISGGTCDMSMGLDV